MKKLLIFLAAGIFSANMYAQSIAAGGYHSLILCTNGNVWACGWNMPGQLGLGFKSLSENSPVQSSFLSGITSIAGGGSHSVFLKNDGTVWTCGDNMFGQLGDNTNNGTPTPVQVSGLANIIKIAKGSSSRHSVFLKSDGTVWACGWNAAGQLGDGTNNNSNIPVQVSGLNNIIDIAVGGSHTLFLKNDGTVWACGENVYGQLGDSTNINQNTPVQVSGLTNIIAIAGGAYHSLFLKDDGTVWACGRNNMGQLGIGTTTNSNIPVQITSLSGITAVSAGWEHSLFLKNDGTAWACGANIDGQLGDGTNNDQSTPVQVIGLTNVSAIAAGGEVAESFSIFQKNDGTVWACGGNNRGQLGNGTTTSSNIPVQMNSSCITVSIDPISSNENVINVFPNPANSQLFINNTQAGMLEVYSMDGRLIECVNVITTYHTLNVSQYAQGMYMLRLIGNDGYVYQNKFIKE